MNVEKFCKIHNKPFEICEYKLYKGCKLPIYRCRDCRNEKNRQFKNLHKKSYLSPCCKISILRNICKDNDFNLHLIGFDFLTNSVFEESLPVDFVKNNYNTRSSIEDFVAFWYEQKGFLVKRLFASAHIKHSSDLLVELGNNKRFIEVKSPTDSLKLGQFLFLQETKGIIVWLEKESELTLLKKSFGVNILNNLV